MTADENSSRTVEIMNKRPLSVILVSLLLIASGAAGLAYHLREINVQHPFQNDTVWIEFVRLLAIVSGVFMLRGHNWARWLAMAWIGFHGVISFFHSWTEVAVHCVVFAVFAYVLFRPLAAKYFRGEQRLMPRIPRHGQ
jgi:formate-dependent nitrite reductase membrane component NrfD